MKKLRHCHFTYIIYVRIHHWHKQGAQNLSARFELYCKTGQVETVHRVFRNNFYAWFNTCWHMLILLCIYALSNTGPVSILLLKSCVQLRCDNDMHFKGTLRRRLSHGYFSFIAKYTSNWLMSYRSHPQIFTFKEAGPNFLAWRGEIWSMLW